MSFLTSTYSRFLFQVNSLKKGTILIFLFFVLISIFLISNFTKTELHLVLNDYNSSFLDVFFKYITYLGDGVMFGFLIVLFFFLNKRIAKVFSIAGILTLLLTHLFKKIIFKGVPRPVKLIGEESLHLVEGVKMAMWNSFPSGHTTAAFAIFTVLILYHSKKIIQYVWIILAVLIGLSRVYLSQHFWIDVFAGAFLGVFIGFVSMMIFFSEKN